MCDFWHVSHRTATMNIHVACCLFYAFVTSNAVSVSALKLSAMVIKSVIMFCLLQFKLYKADYSESPRRLTVVGLCRLYLLRRPTRLFTASAFSRS